MRIKGADLEQKSPTPTPDPFVPPLLSAEFEQVRDAVLASFPTTLPSPEEADVNSTERHISLKSSSKQSGQWVSVANISRRLADGQPAISIEAEVEECFHTLRGTRHEDSSTSRLGSPSHFSLQINSRSIPCSSHTAQT